MMDKYSDAQLAAFSRYHEAGGNMENLSDEDLTTLRMALSGSENPEAVKPQTPQGAPQGAPQEELSLGGAGSKAIENLPSSMLKLLKDTAYSFLHPIETAETLGDAAKGYFQMVRELSPPGQQGRANPFDKGTAEAINKHYGDRFGSWANVKQTLATDPAGLLSDVALPLTLGGSSLARVPGVIGRVGRTARTVGTAVDPFNIAVKGAAFPLNVAAKLTPEILSLTTGAGSAPIREAVRAGREGGPRAQAFKGSMRGDIPASSILEEARANLIKMRDAKHSDYLRSAEDFRKNNQVLDIRPIRDSLNSIRSSMMEQGIWAVGKNAQNKIKELEKIVSEWEVNPGLHNVSGFDALKRRIRDEMPGMTEANIQGSRAVAKLSDDIKNIIVREVPSYAEAMAKYEHLSSIETEITKTLSLGRGATNDTALRKLLSSMRSNVNANFGSRLDSVKTLDAGASNIVPKIAGQSLSQLTPMGLARIHTGAGVGSILSGILSPAAIPALLATSPRVVGEAAFSTGAASRPYNRAFPYLPARSTAVGAGQGARQIGIGAQLQSQPGGLLDDPEETASDRLIREARQIGLTRGSFGGSAGGQSAIP